MANLCYLRRTNNIYMHETCEYRAKLSIICPPFAVFDNGWCSVYCQTQRKAV